MQKTFLENNYQYIDFEYQPVDEFKIKENSGFMQ